MIKLKGKYSTAKVFTDNIDQETISQIINLCSQDFTKDSTIRIMPDTHAGKGCVIGFTANLGNKVIPNIVGVDIGCGMLCVELGEFDPDLQKLDDVIHKYIPAGRDIHEGRIIKFPELLDLYCYRQLKETKRIERSIGTLGGGNHFIELNQDNERNIYLVIHSGSRNLGKQVADYYQNLAIEMRSGKEEYYQRKDQIIKDYKEQGQRNEIQSALKNLEKEYQLSQPDYPKELCFLEGVWRNQYLHDMDICQRYALLNRETMASIILDKWLDRNYHHFESFQTIHNYINFKDNIIRKGSISAYKDEKVIIPINMRDGSLLCVGKGNPDWNYSAPHGAGRLMSRSKAKENISMDEYQKSMEGIFTTSISLSTLDEAPMAYKSMDEIINNVGDTVDILKVIKPIYNFKAGE
jgi:tRNA-splicing ligase RtcB